MTPHLQAVLRDLKAGLQRLYGERLTEVVLYGSQARGDANDDSDIDVLIVLRGEVVPGSEVRLTSRLIADLSLKYDVLLSRMFVSETSYRGRQDALIRSARREGVPL